MIGRGLNSASGIIKKTPQRLARRGKNGERPSTKNQLASWIGTTEEEKIVKKNQKLIIIVEI